MADKDHGAKERMKPREVVSSCQYLQFLYLF